MPSYGQHNNGQPYRQTTFVHLNGNLLAAIDVKTTGQDSTAHEIYEIGIIPVDSFLVRRHDKMPLDLLIKPNYPEKIDWNFLEKHRCATQIKNAIAEGHPKHVARMLFQRWLEDLKLPERKLIAPLGYNYSHESRFLRCWLGHLSYGLIFDDLELRDVRVIANFMNELADIRGAPYPFRKKAFSELANTLGVFKDYGRVRSALHDAAITADIYRAQIEMMKRELIS